MNDYTDISADPMLALAVTNPQAVELARRRKLAERLIGSNLQQTAPREIAGNVLPWQPGNAIGDIANRLAGKIDIKGVSADEQDLAQREAGNTATLLEQLGLPPGQAQALAASPDIRKTVATLLDMQSDSADRRAAIDQRREQAQENAQLRRDIADQASADRRFMAGMRVGGGGGGKPPKGSPGAGYYWVQDNDGNWAADVIPNGPKDPNGPNFVPPTTKAPTQDQANANLFASRMEASDKIINDIGTGYSPLKVNLLEAVPVGAGNYFMSPTEQRVSQSQRDFLNSVLRRESGAVISPAEFESGKKQYFPAPGDSEAVLKQKKANRQTAIAGIRTAAGPVTSKTTGGGQVSDDPTADTTTGAGDTEWKEGDHGEIDGQRFVIRNGKPEVY